jgi:hypothetical protein
MRRSLFWATVALYPLVAVLVGGGASEYSSSAIVGTGPVGEFISAYWWTFLATPAVMALLFFLLHALLSIGTHGLSRILWAVGVLLLGPVVAPVYWWLYSDAT